MAITISGAGITSAQIQADGIDGTKIADDAIDSEHIAAGGVDDAHIASGVDASKLTTGTLPAARISSLDATKLTGTIASGRLSAANLGSGTVPTARLGSGTANNAVFLRGDSTWATAGSTSASDLTSGTLPIARIADDAITLAKMASGTDGNIISYDASGNPVAIATGSDGQVLTSTGAGSPPAFEDVAAGVGGATGVDFNDNTKARFGTGNDLEIYHDGTDSYIHDSGSGNLELRTNGAQIGIMGNDGSEYMGKFVQDGAVELYHNNVKKLETSADGIKFTGKVYTESDGLVFNAGAGNTTGKTLDLKGNTGYNGYISLSANDGGVSTVSQLRIQSGTVGQGSISWWKKMNSGSLTEAFKINNYGYMTLYETSDDGKAQFSTNSYITLADDASVTYGGVGGSIIMLATNSSTTMYRSAMFYAEVWSGNIVKVADPGGGWYDTADTDGKICIYKSGNSGSFTLKNRIGSTKAFSISILHCGGQ